MMQVKLNLTIEGKWFDMIARGEKLEEYCGFGNSSVIKIVNEATHSLCREMSDWCLILRNGCNMNSRALAVKILNLGIRKSDRHHNERMHPEWGEPKTHKAYLVIYLGSIVAKGTYAEVKRQTAEN